MNSILLKAQPNVNAKVSVPGSKSISNRVLLIAALAKNNTLLYNILFSDDILWMLRALVSLGVAIYDLSEESEINLNLKQDHEQSTNIGLELTRLSLETIDIWQQALASNLENISSDHNSDEENSFKLSSIPQSLILLIKGNNGLFQVKGDFNLYLGNAGTAFRPLLAALAFNTGKAKFYIHGEERMHQRPLLDLANALEILGADLEYLENKGYAPLIVTTNQKSDLNHNISFYNIEQNAYNYNKEKQIESAYPNLNLETETRSSVVGSQSAKQTLCMPQVDIKCSVSSQYLTSLLMIAPLLPQGLKINLVDKLISKPYIELTLALMKEFGVEVAVNQSFTSFTVLPQSYQSGAWMKFADSSNRNFLAAVQSWLNQTSNDNKHNNSDLGVYTVESDASSASYFFISGALAGRVTIDHINLDLNQGDVKLLAILEQVGAVVSATANSITVSTNSLLLSQTGYACKNFDVDCNDIPDAAMGLAIISLFTPPDKPNILRNIGSWKVKETDRIVAMATELTKIGAIVLYTDDTISIQAPQNLQTANIDTYKDHRMAMCFSLVSLNKQNINITINNPNCVNKTFPHFFTVFKQLTTN